MSLRGILALLIAAISVGAVVFLTRSYISSIEANQPVIVQAPRKEPDVRIFVAKSDLPPGRILKVEDLQSQAWPKAALNPAYIQIEGGQNTLAGMVLRTSLTAGEPVTRSALVAPGERGFMAAILTPGMRAATINLTPVAGVGGFIFPGDRVDVILTQDINAAGIGSIVSETVMQNIRVLGVDQATEQSENGPKIRRTATLEVTPKMAEKVAMLERLGTLSLSLRSLARDNATEDPKPISVALTGTLAHEVSSYLPDPTEQQKAQTPTLVVRRGRGAAAIQAQQSQSENTPAENTQAQRADAATNQGDGS